MKSSVYSVKPIFWRNRNVRNFEVMMQALDMSSGEGRMGLISGQAGLGKTRTAQWWAANNRCVYLRMLSIWKSSEIDFLRALGKELGITTMGRRKASCFGDVIERLLPSPTPIFLDEPEKLPRSFLELFRDLSDTTASPVILIGEEELPGYMSRDRRIWTRTFYQLAFEPLQTSDVMTYAMESTGLALAPEVAAVLVKCGIGHRVTDGNFRAVKRALITLTQIMASYKTTEPTVEMAQMAIKTGL